MMVTVDADDLRAVLAVVPRWVPEGCAGDGDWTGDSLRAQQRLYAELEKATGLVTAEPTSVVPECPPRRG